MWLHCVSFLRVGGLPRFLLSLSLRRLLYFQVNIAENTFSSLALSRSIPAPMIMKVSTFSCILATYFTATFIKELKQLLLRLYHIMRVYSQHYTVRMK